MHFPNLVFIGNRSENIKIIDILSFGTVNLIFGGGRMLVFFSDNIGVRLLFSPALWVGFFSLNISTQQNDIQYNIPNTLTLYPRFHSRQLNNPARLSKQLHTQSRFRDNFTLNPYFTTTSHSIKVFATTAHSSKLHTQIDMTSLFE